MGAFFDWLAQVMAVGLGLFFHWTNSYGLAIILLVIAIRILMVPLTMSQIRSTMRMQALQPELAALQKKYKNDPQKLNQEMMELYRRNKVNPFAGCLPTLLQIPFFVSLFRLLEKPQAFLPADLAGRVGERFLWIGNLSTPDLYVLPLLNAVTMYWQMRIATPRTGTAQDQQTMIMAITMPLLIGWMSMRFPAGLTLYWVVSNVFGVVQQYLTPHPRWVVKGDAER